MMFCKKCGSLVLPKDGMIVCTKCGSKRKISKGDNYKLTHSGTKKKELVIIDDEIETMPTTRAECPKCKNMKAEWWLRQTRGADEPETRFFRCTKCKFTWREYN